MDIFGSSERVNLSFDKATLKVNKADDKVATFSFAAFLTAENVVTCPHWIQAAYEAVETRSNAVTRADMADLQIKSVNIAFYALPESDRKSVELLGVTLEGLRVERGTSRHVDTHLYFDVEVKIEDRNDLKLWMVDNCFRQLFAEFQNAQPDLIDQAIAGFVKPIADNSGIDSVTLSTADTSVTITKEDAKHIRRNAGKKVN